MEHFGDGRTEALMDLYQVGRFVDLNGAVPYNPGVDGIAELFLDLAGEAEFDSALRGMMGTSLR